MSMQTPLATAIFIGKTADYQGMQTAINKQPIISALYLSEHGLEGNECADKKHHGGSDRALHHYPAEHYSYWQSKYSDSDKKWQAPGMGENITSVGMTEDSVYIGDKYQFGEAIIEVSQPRSPCFKLNRYWQVEDISVCMQENSRCGWLYRVIKPGFVKANDPLVLISRDDDSLSVKQVCDMFFAEPLNQSSLVRLKQLSKLSQGWRDTVEQRLVTGKLENWSFRLLDKPSL